ncbi:hypothetical protein HYS31_07425 [Candidatus Woesearchaeota archaeon]|nr:hypothetical protein [Candidatus Woesearchaeota archaeon]
MSVISKNETYFNEQFIPAQVNFPRGLAPAKLRLRRKNGDYVVQIVELLKDNPVRPFYNISIPFDDYSKAVTEQNRIKNMLESGAKIIVTGIGQASVCSIDEIANWQ